MTRARPHVFRDMRSFRCSSGNQLHSLPMQDRYSFDVGDFGKFGLLRALLQAATVRTLGVIWYYSSVPSRADDGRHLGYLQLTRPVISKSADRFRQCDPGLFDLFRGQLRENAERSVAVLESVGLFGQRCPSYFREPVES